MGIRLKFQILEWKCQNGCGTTLSELDYTTNKKYCPECTILVTKERKRKYDKKYRLKNKEKFPNRPVNKKQEILYVLKTNGLATVGELTAFSGVKEITVRNYIWMLRRKHWIKFKDKFYYYFGEKENEL